MSVQSHSMRPIVARKHSGIERRHPSIGQPREVDARIKPEIAPKIVTHPLKVLRFDYFQPQLRARARARMMVIPLRNGADVPKHPHVSAS